MSNLQDLSNLLYLFSNVTSIFSNIVTSIGSLNSERIIAAYTDADGSARAESLYSKTEKRVYLSALVSLLGLSILSFLIFKKYNSLINVNKEIQTKKKKNKG